MVRYKVKTKLYIYDVTAMLVALVYSFVMTYLSFLKFEGFRYSSLDLGIFTQSLAGFLDGKPLFNTVEWQLYGVSNHFGVHFQPILLLLVPVFRLFPSPETLLLVQSLAIGSSVFLAYLLAKKVLGKKLGLILAVLYALNPSLMGICLFEFHPVSLAVPLFLLSAYFLFEGKAGAFYILSLLVLLVKEDAFLGVASLSLWWALRGGFSWKSLRKNLPFLLLAVLSVLYGLILIKLVIPHLGSGYIYGHLYRGVHVTGRKLAYFLLFNLSFGLLPLFLPRNWVLLALPWLESLLTSRPSQYTFGFHYPYMLAPLSFIGAVFALRELELGKILPVLIAVGLMTSWATIPLAEKPPEEPFSLVHYSVLEPIPGHKTAWKVINAILKTNLSVYTQPAFYPALAVKQNVYIYPKGIKPDVLLVDVKTYHGRIYLRRLFEMVGKNYTLVYSRDGVQLYLRDGLKLPLPLEELD